jgi:hypothetical protein
VGLRLAPPSLLSRAAVDLNEVLGRLRALPAAERSKIENLAFEGTARLVWVPNPGPQSDAYYSEADELLYGGEAGGGKSDLGIGLALNAHQRSLILREFKDDARGLGDRLVEIVGSRAGWNEQTARWRSGARIIDFDGLPNEKDKQRHKGKPHDLIVFDEIVDFFESQYDFIVGWNRSTVPGQRSRVVCTGNPPTRAKGLWVIKHWAPWLDKTHPNPAKDGELRWFLRNADGESMEVDGPGPYDVDGKPTVARSRTFIRGKLKDNPDLAGTGYDAMLGGLPKELRDAYRDGKFDAALKDHPFQVIPTMWIQAAQARWTARPPHGIPMCGMGVDPAGGSGGGGDRFTIAVRHDWWFAPIVCIPAKEIRKASDGAGHIIAVRYDDAPIVIDMGGGYGSGCFERLQDNGIEPIAHKGSMASTQRTYPDRKLGFYNKRSEVYWRLREALDPDQLGGSPIALPPDPELVSDLTVLTFEVGTRGIQVLSKEDVLDALGRSPDKGDAVSLAWSAGPRGLVPMAGVAQTGREQKIGSRRGAQPKVDLGPRHRRRH